MSWFSGTPPLLPRCGHRNGVTSKSAFFYSVHGDLWLPRKLSCSHTSIFKALERAVDLDSLAVPLLHELISERLQNDCRDKLALPRVAIWSMFKSCKQSSRNRQHGPRQQDADRSWTQKTLLVRAPSNRSSNPCVALLVFHLTLDPTYSYFFLRPIKLIYHVLTCLQKYGYSQWAPTNTIDVSESRKAEGPGVIPRYI